LQDTARRLLPEEVRLHSCLRFRHALAETVDIRFSEEYQRAFYAGLQTCGSVWQCPICAAKISERRRGEVSQALDTCLREGGRAFLVTLTVSHGVGDDLRRVLSQVREARAKWRKGKMWDKWMRRLGFIGSIRSLENTHGANGFHPHTHELFLLSADPDEADVIEFERWASAKWRRCVEQVGGWANEHGFNLQRDMSDATYLDKDAEWNFSHEVTKSNLKNSHSKSGRSMNRLLHEAAEGDHEAGRLWAIYAKTFKGQRHIVWSDGLKKRYLPDVEQLSDEEAAQVAEDDATQLLASLEGSEFQKVVRLGLRGEVLDLAGQGDAFLLREYLAVLDVDVIPANKLVTSCQQVDSLQALYTGPPT
jgi:hypothetical protein